MLVYSLYILSILFLRLNLIRFQTEIARARAEDRYFHFMAFVLLLLTALRGSNVGTDTQNYLIMYVYYIPSYSFKEVYYVLSGSPLSFYLFKIFSVLQLPPQFLLGTVFLIYLSAIVRLIDKFSNDKLISLLCFFVFIGLYNLSVPALKQCSAMGLALHGFLYLYDKKYIKAGILAVLAFYFHKTSAIFLLGYLLWYVRDRKYYYTIIGVAFLLCVLSSQTVVRVLIDIVNDEHYSEYYNESSSYTWVTFFYYLILIIYSSFFLKRYSKYNRDDARLFFGFALFATALQSLSAVIPTAFRLAAYFLPSFIILLPNITIGLKEERVYKTVLMLFLLFMFFYTGRNGGNIFPYKFFWQEYDIPYIYWGG